MKSIPILLVLAVIGSGCTAPASDRGGADGAPDYVIPHMSVRPKLDTLIGEAEWQDALRIDSTFVIANGGAASGVYPFTLWMGVDEQALHMAVEVRDIGPNPFGIPGILYFPDNLEIFVTAASGPLESPSDWFSEANGRGYGSSFDDGFWTGTRWELQAEMGPGSFNDGYPVEGRWGVAGNTTDTQTWEFYIPRTSSLSEYDGLQLEGPTDFRMALKFVRQDDTENDPPYSPRRHTDDFPGDGPTPPIENDPSTWLLLRTAI